MSGRVREGEEELFTEEQTLQVIDYEHKEQFDQVIIYFLTLKILRAYLRNKNFDFWAFDLKTSTWAVIP